MGDTNSNTEEGEFILTPEKIESALPMFNLEATDDGLVREIESGEVLTNENTGEDLTLQDLKESGVIAPGEDNRIVPVEDSFPYVVEHFSDRDLDYGDEE